MKADTCSFQMTSKFNVTGVYFRCVTLQLISDQSMAEGVSMIRRDFKTCLHVEIASL